MNASAKPHAPEYTLIYDGFCDICRRSMDVLRAWDKQGVLEIVASQSPGVADRFPQVPAEAFDRSWQFICPNGSRHEGSDALEQILTVLPRGRWFRWIFFIPFVRPISARMYWWFAARRRLFGCGEHCRIPGADGGG